MKKILLSIMIIAVVIAIAAGGTMAYFSTTSTIPNSVSSATLNMTTQPASGSYGIQATNIVPGWQSERIEVKGNNDSGVDLKIFGDITYSGSNALAEALDVYQNDVKVGTLATIANSGGLTQQTGIEAGGSTSIIYQLKLPNIEAPQNDLQGKSLTANLIIEGRASE